MSRSPTQSPSTSSTPTWLPSASPLPAFSAPVPQVVNATVARRIAQISNAVFELATFHVDFDRPLYTASLDHHCPPAWPSRCAEIQGASGACPYDGTAVPYGSVVVCGRSTVGNRCIVNNCTSRIDGSSSLDLSLGDEFTATVSQAFRLFVPPGSCQGFRLRVVGGMKGSSVRFSPPSVEIYNAIGARMQYPLYYRDTIDVCAADSFFTPGWFVFRVVPSVPAEPILMRVEALPETPELPWARPPLPSACLGPNTELCLTDGQVVTWQPRGLGVENVGLEFPLAQARSCPRVVSVVAMMSSYESVGGIALFGSWSDPSVSSEANAEYADRNDLLTPLVALTLDLWLDTEDLDCLNRRLFLNLRAQTRLPLRLWVNAYTESGQVPMRLISQADPSVAQESATFGWRRVSASLRCPVAFSPDTDSPVVSQLPSSLLFFDRGGQGMGGVLPRAYPDYLTPLLISLTYVTSVSDLQLAALDGFEQGQGDVIPNRISMSMVLPAMWAPGLNVDTRLSVQIPRPEECTIQLLNVFSNDGRPSLARIGSSPDVDARRRAPTLPIVAASTPACDTTALAQWVPQFDALQESMHASNATSYDVATQLVRTSAMLILDDWAACEAAAQSLLVPAVVQPTVFSQACDYPSGLLLCCHREPSNTSALEPVFASADSSALSDSCTNRGCAKLLSEEYLSARADARYCNDPLANFGLFSVVNRRAWADCSRKALGASFIRGIECHTDSDCPSGQCAVLYQRCVSLSRDSDLAFLDCLETTASARVLTNVKALFANESVTLTDPLSSLLPLISRSQCVGTAADGQLWQAGSLLERAGFLGSGEVLPYDPYFSITTTYGECSMFQETVHSAALLSGTMVDLPRLMCPFNFWTFAPARPSQSTCALMKRCAWTNGPLAQASDLTQCPVGQTTPTCVVCESPSDPCLATSGSLGTSQSNCESVSGVCISPRSLRMTPVASETDCNSSAFGECSIDCYDQVCAELQGLASVCLLPAVTDPNSCTFSNGRWSLNRCVSTIYSTNQLGCASVGGLWETDPCIINQTLSTCSGRSSPSGYLRCGLSMSPRPCSFEECAAAGECTDRSLLREKVDMIAWPVRSRVCIAEKAPLPGSSSDGGWGTCGYDVPRERTAGFTYGNGCAVITREHYLEQDTQLCTTMYNSSWYTLATNESECVGRLYQCLENPETAQRPVSALDILGMAGEMVRTQRPPAVCEAKCNATVVPAFSWTRGTWLSPTFRRVQWMNQSQVPSGAWAPRLDYSKLGLLWEQAIAKEGLLAQQAYALCNTPRRIEAVLGVTRLCSGQAEAATLPLPPKDTQASVFRVCANDSSVASANGDRFTFRSADAIVGAGCVVVTAYATSVQALAHPPHSDLFALFLPRYTLGGRFESVRHNGKVAGAVIGNAVGLDVSAEQGATASLREFQLCLALSAEARNYTGSNLQKYKRPAIGVVDGFLLSILSADAELQYLPVIGGDSAEFVCANVTYDRVGGRPIAPIMIPHELPSAEVADSVIAVFSLMGAAFLAGCLYLVALQIYADCFLRQAGGWVLRLMRLFFLLAFLIRALYLFLAAGGVYTADSVANYVLSLLPTPLYFTAFSGTVAAWGATAVGQRLATKNVLDRRAISRRVLSFAVTFLLAINAVVYVFFIALMAAAGAVGVESTTQCFGRVKNTNTDVQQALALTLAVGVMLLALALVLILTVSGFLIFGSPRKMWRLGMGLVVMVGAFGAIQLLLHCIMLIALTAASPNTSEYAAFVLLFTEILPGVVVSSIGLITVKMLTCGLVKRSFLTPSSAAEKTTTSASGAAGGKPREVKSSSLSIVPRKSADGAPPEIPMSAFNAGVEAADTENPLTNPEIFLRAARASQC